MGRAQLAACCLAYCVVRAVAVKDCLSDRIDVGARTDALTRVLSCSFDLVSLRVRLVCQTWVVKESTLHRCTDLWLLLANKTLICRNFLPE